ncbi:50S ribosomal protein L5 [bacterium]|nr:50S ribosomal protein L5 [bacterium]|tara:strand:+ start:99 stop:677 length:579 start_codon:yes stop_codon:yes gene_type:complete
MTTELTKQYAAVAEALNLKNVHEVPVITKVTVTTGVGKNRDNKSYLESVKRDLALVTGQVPQVRRARLAIAGFNVRQDNIVGYRATLRGKRATDFTKRFVSVTLPRVRDFRGISLNSLDGQGNLSVGIVEQLAFPEILPEKTDIVFGIEVTFSTSAKTKQDAEVLFRALGFPLTQADEKREEATVDIRQGKK